MNQEAINLLCLKRKIAKAEPRIRSNEFAHRLRMKVADANSGWSYVSGERFIDEWGTKGKNNEITREQFVHCKHPDGSWDSRRNLLSTFQDMIAIDLVELDNGSLVVVISVDEGEGLNGRLIGRRCKFVIEGPWWEIKEFQEGVERRFVQKCVNYEEQEEAHRRAQRVTAIYDELLAGTYVPVNSEEDDE